MNYSFKYDKTELSLDIDDKNMLMELVPNEVSVSLKNAEEVNRAILNPIGSKRLSEIVKKGEKVVLVTSDITRPMPSGIVVPEVLKELAEAGVSDDDITIVFAMGIHRFHTEDEKKYLVGEDIYNRIKCVDSDPEEYMDLGTTERGTPVEIYKPVAEADRIICLGNIEFHYFAGYSGGAKAIMPGVSTRAAIQANHKRMIEKQSHAGNIETNAVRQDIDEVSKFVKIDFIVNVVLNEKKEIIKAVAGHHIDAHREGCKFLDTLYKVSIPERADVVITCPAGFPKDINLYQAQKALDNAKLAVKKGGIVILVASCKEGFGEDVFERWIMSAEKPNDLIDGIKKNFELGGHKAAAIAMVMEEADVYIVSDFSEEEANRIFMKPFKSLDEAYKVALAAQGQNAKTIIMPLGGSTLPICEE